MGDITDLFDPEPPSETEGRLIRRILQLEADLAAVIAAARNLHASVEMAESVGVCLPDRTPSLVLGSILERFH